MLSRLFFFFFKLLTPPGGVIVAYDRVDHVLVLDDKTVWDLTPAGVNFSGRLMLVIMFHHRVRLRRRQRFRRWKKSTAISIDAK